MVIKTEFNSFNGYCIFRYMFYYFFFYKVCNIRKRLNTFMVLFIHLHGFPYKNVDFQFTRFYEQNIYCVAASTTCK